MNRKGIRIMAAMLCFTASLGLLFSACRKSKPGDDPVPVDGGNTTYQDPDAPKTVESKDLTEFSAVLWLDTRYRGDEYRLFDFSVAPDESGTPVASEAETGISAPADRDLLDALAAIIAQYGLAAQNGLYDVTAGLPPEFEAHPFTARYASGEEISFTVNNDPTSAWGEAVYDLFDEWFSARGEHALDPAADRTLLTRFDLEITDGERYTCYGGIHVDEDSAIDGETYLLEKEEIVGEPGADPAATILFPADYYEKLTAIIADSPLERNYVFSYYDRAAGNNGNHDEGYFGWGDKTTADNEPDAEDRAVSIYLEYESGRRINIDTRKRSEIEAMQPLLDRLTAYLDPLFQ